MAQNIDIYLFDWGDTLMKDFTHQSGKMCDWKIVEACVVMIGDSFEKDIKPALECGIKAIWLQETNTQNTTVSTIKNLRELLSF